MSYTTNLEIQDEIIGKMGLGVDYYKGEQGIPGKDGKTPVKGVDYFTDAEITEIKDEIVEQVQVGAKGEDGKSAYQLAVEAGYEGSETEWLASLKGKDGKDGTNGINGTNGKDGKDGTNGVDGKMPVKGVDYFTTAEIQQIEEAAAAKVDLSDYAKTADLSTVATSGSYNDLSDKPSIPEPYELPIASTSTLGGVKVDGSTITITDGVISSKGGSGGGTADVFTGVGEDTITTEKTFEDSSFSFNKAKFLEVKGVKEKEYGYYQLRSNYEERWYMGNVYYSENGISGWIVCDNVAIQGGAAPYGCAFSNSSFFISGKNNTITIHYVKGAAGTTGLVPAPTDNGKVLGSNGEWILVNMVSTIKTGTGTNSEKFNDDNNKASGNYSHAEGQSTQATGTAAHAEGLGTSAGSYSHSEGYGTNSMGSGSHSEGYSNGSINSMMAQGDGSHCEGYTTNAVKRASHAGSHMEGYSDSSDGIIQQYAQGNGSHCEGWNTYCANNTTAAAHTEGRATVAGSAYQHVEGKYNIIDTETAYQHITGNGTSHAERSNSYTLDWSGNAVFAGTVSNSGADYAEYFEWLDENDNVDDRVGYIVTLEGNKIKFANSEDDVLGIVSGTATVLGDNAEWEWQGKYLKDEFGRKIIDWVEHKSTTTIYNDDGTSKEKEISLGFFPEPRINPNYNENEEYVNRYWRPEWDAVGLMGKLFVRDNGSCQVGSYVKPDNGIAIPSAEKTNMRVLKRVNNNVIQVLLK